MKVEVNLRALLKALPKRLLNSIEKYSIKHMNFRFFPIWRQILNLSQPSIDIILSIQNDNNMIWLVVK